MKNKVKILAAFLVLVVIISVQSFTVSATEKSDEEKELYNEYVIVLDSGHDSEHVGARGNGLLEEKVNQIITEACKEELEKCKNITVYLTHDGLTCPYPGTDAKDCNKSRCDFAASVDADYFISIHANFNTSRSRNGFEIIYPNTHYKPEFNATGEALSNYIVEELKTTGMKFRNIWTRDSTEYKKNDENYYPDGTRADYYNVIRNSKYHDILGIIIEHGYISNWSDAKNYLSSEEKLKEFGVADARGIINYLYSLEQADENTEIKALITNTIDDVIDYFAVFKILF